MRIAEAIAHVVDQALAARRKVGTVTGISGSRVIVSVQGGSLTLPRLASYAPTIGDVVHIDASVPGAWLVLGKSA
ncbi:hypothetical protein [Amycolatopsis sp. CA-230715]|uniref:hypothetical protein n=1 Tax=Amycolatopsis sp. CA-230715 TaxID=2745196 RepID=UPI001C025CD4|nr:hypothetical protein [Amycolatopsis sp. CA-230715]QWF78695.1 hypothetical protein HUW46_02093 [Amycolatopsis sp. CA-230715]